MRPVPGAAGSPQLRGAIALPQPRAARGGAKTTQRTHTPHRGREGSGPGPPPAERCRCPSAGPSAGPSPAPAGLHRRPLTDVSASPEAAPPPRGVFPLPPPSSPFRRAAREVGAGSRCGSGRGGPAGAWRAPRGGRRRRLFPPCPRCREAGRGPAPAGVAVGTALCAGRALRGRPVSCALLALGIPGRCWCLGGNPDAMQNDAGEFVDLYVPRKW